MIADNMSTTSSNEDVTMDDVARIMREEDAQLLESMHFNSHHRDDDEDDDGEGVDDRDEDGVDDHIEVYCGEEELMDMSSSNNNNNMKKKKRLFRSYSSGNHSDGTGGAAGAGGGSVILPEGDDENAEPPVIYRQCLSGEIKSIRSPSPHHHPHLVVGKIPPEADETTNDTEEETAVTVATTSHELLVMAANSPAVKRSISSNRRINEAVQFAEAVGEMPPLVDTNELCIIEEDNDDDDTDEDDDTDANVVVHHQEYHDHTTVEVEFPSSASVGANTRQDFSMDGSLCELPPINTNAVGGGESVGGPPSVVLNCSREQLLPVPLTRRKSRPKWPFQLPGWTFSRLDTSMHKTLEATAEEYVYKGIPSNPPEIVKRGTSRGNHVQLHRKAWLEVSDKYHRYGKNLRLYYRHWESLGYPTNDFFSWLDSKGDAAGQPLPNLDECPRSKLDSDSVLYITNPEVTQGYALQIVITDGRARFVDVDGEMVQTGPEGWIFVLRDGVIYGAEKVTSISGQSKKRFHHSSFFGGKAVAAAGIFITNEEGYLVRLYPHSGHYRPREAHMQRLLYFLYHQGVDLRTFEMDIQQIMHVARDNVGGDKKKKDKKSKDKEGKKKSGKEQDDGNNKPSKPEGEKKKKIDSLQLMPAVSVACYVAHKAHFIGEGVFAQIHQLKTANVASVSEALQLLNRKKRISVTPRDQTLANSAASGAGGEN